MIETQPKASEMKNDKPKRKRKPHAVVLDYDDTVVDFMGFLCSVHNLYNGTCMTKNDVKGWGFKGVSLTDARGNTVTGEELMNTFKTYEKHGIYASLPVIREARKAIYDMRTLGYKVIILTARDEKYKEQTEINAMHQKVVYDELHFSSDKVKILKELSKRYNIRAFADDRAQTVLKVMDKSKVKNVFLVDAAHNRNLDEIATEMNIEVEDGDIKRIRDIYEILRELPDVNPK